jgi:pSer/pThr/pTyr-binding forkhead associated (FHA) protein
MDLLYIVLGALIVLVIALAITVGARVVRRRRPPPAPEPPPPEAPESIAALEYAGEGAHVHYAIRKPLIIIGRGVDADMHISPDVPGARSVSRRHAQIRRDDVDFVVEDLGSQNGIRVNGLVTQRNLLRDGYRVAFGSVEFVFRLSQPGDADRSRS